MSLSKSFAAWREADGKSRTALVAVARRLAHAVLDAATEGRPPGADPQVQKLRVRFDSLRGALTQADNVIREISQAVGADWQSDAPQFVAQADDLIASASKDAASLLQRRFAAQGIPMPGALPPPEQMSRQQYESLSPELKRAVIQRLTGGNRR